MPALQDTEARQRRLRRDLADRSGLAARLTLVEDVDGYEESVQGIVIKALRTGVGFGPNLVRAIGGDRLVSTRVDVQFPMMSRTTMGDDRVIAGCITAAPSGGRWCGVDLEPGMVVVYGPEAEHTAINPAGLGFGFAAVRRQVLETVARRRRATVAPPPPGQMHVLAPTSEAKQLGRALGEMADSAMADAGHLRNWEDSVIDAMISALPDGGRTRRVGASKKIDDRRVVNPCISYAEAIGRIPTLAELCLMAHVSERRLRSAFTESFQVSPSRYFRIWGLNKARHRLTNPDPHAVTSVTRVAIDLGFSHLGRFAARYQNRFGEAPSTTLRAHR